MAIGVATLAVLFLAVSGFLFRRTLIVECYLWQLRSSSAYFRETLQAPGGGPRSQALDLYLRTPRGRQALFLAFAKEVLEQWAEAMAGLANLVKQTPRQRSLEDFHAALLWIGPKTAGLQPASENVAAHVLLKGSPTEQSPVDGSSCIIFKDNRLLISKAILSAIDVLRGSSFVLPEAPSFHFEFMSGDKAVEAFGFSLWHEIPPDSQQTVCFAYRSDLIEGSGGERMR